MAILRLRQRIQLMTGISLVGQAGVNWPGSGAFPLSYSSTGGTTLILAFGFDQASAASDLTVTDSADNTWQYSAVNANDPPYGQVQTTAGGGEYVGSFVAWCIGASAITSVTLSQVNGNRWQGVLSEWNGIMSAGTGAAATNASTTSGITSPSLSLGNSGDLVIAHCNSYGGLSSTTGTTFSDDSPNACYSLPGTTGAFTFTWGNSGTGEAVAVMSFSPVSSGGGVNSGAFLTFFP
jgi:hypothetical protein